MAAKAASTPQKQPAPNVAFSWLMSVEMREGCVGKQFLTEMSASAHCHPHF